MIGGEPDPVESGVFIHHDAHVRHAEDRAREEQYHTQPEEFSQHKLRTRHRLRENEVNHLAIHVLKERRRARKSAMIALKK